jgi:hypothetical protein
MHQFFNPYAYSYNPLTYIDPNGLRFEESSMEGNEEYYGELQMAVCDLSPETFNALSAADETITLGALVLNYTLLAYSQLI